MIFDQPATTSFPSGANLEDFVNMDMLAGPSAMGSSSRSSSNSPSTSFAELPLTPPNPFDNTTSEFFNLNLSFDADYMKYDDTYSFPTAPPFDFMSAFNSTEESSPDSGSTPSSGDSPVTIDPQVMNTPSVSAPSEFDEDEGAADEEEEGEDAENDQDKDDMVHIEPVKVGGKGKNRKGTVQSGGVVKKMSKEKKESRPSGMLSTTSVEPDDWRPTPEEYKKMSSKEKRQLRNKISARNFRVRRKGK